jgi:hypothetical protein
MQIRISNIKLMNNVIQFDYDEVNDTTSEPVPNPPRTTLPSTDLPEGYDTNKTVAYNMLLQAMSEHNLTPTGVQGHGDEIVMALRDTWPGLKVYVHPQSDAPMWYGFGPIDVTIDSGKGGWSFQTPGTPDMFDENYYHSIYGES